MTWLSLSEATTVVAHDVQKARERLERAISKAWVVVPGTSPQETSDPNVPLRIQLMLSPGLRIDGRGGWKILCYIGKLPKSSVSARPGLPHSDHCRHRHRLNPS